MPWSGEWCTPPGARSSRAQTPPLLCAGRRSGPAAPTSAIFGPRMSSTLPAICVRRHACRRSRAGPTPLLPLPPGWKAAAAASSAKTTVTCVLSLAARPTAMLWPSSATLRARCGGEARGCCVPCVKCRDAHPASTQQAPLCAHLRGASLAVGRSTQMQSWRAALRLNPLLLGALATTTGLSCTTHACSASSICVQGG